MNKWAEKRGFRIERSPHHGPQIIWLQGGSLSAREDRISIFIVVRRPRSRGNGGSDQAAEVITTGETPSVCQEPPSKVKTKSPISGPLFAESPFECQVGDVIILEGGEQLIVRPQDKGDTGPRGICMLAVLHRTTPKEGTGGNGAQQ